MPSGWMPEMDVFAQWQLDQQQPFAIGRMQQHTIEQQSIAKVPISPPVSVVGMKRGRMSELDQTMFGKRHCPSAEFNGIQQWPTDQSQAHLRTMDAVEQQKEDNEGKQAEMTAPVVEAERQYNDGYVEYFSGSAQTMEHQSSTDHEMETLEEVPQSQQQSQSASPNTCEQYVTKGCYSPRQVQSYCRPTFGRSGDVCMLFPYHSDCY